VIYAAKQGAVARTVELTEHRYDLDALLDAVTSRTKLVYICHPNNPTGTMNTTDELDRYFERVPEHVLTVIDQAYFEYIDRVDYPDAIERYLKAGRQVAVLRTFSKIYGLAGLRVGYAVAPGNVVCAAMAKVRRPFDITTPAQVAALASIGEDVELARRRTVNAEGLARLESLLREHGLAPVPSVGNFVYVDTGGDANVLFEQLLREGIIVRPLTGFGSTTAIRISVGAPDELDHLAVALARVLQPA
jgi:histidinol-phosphate aminotransferase